MQTQRDRTALGDQGPVPGTGAPPTPGPARLRSLLPYAREHRRALVAVALLSLVGAVLTLAQPALVSRLISGLGTGGGLGSGTVRSTALLLAVALVVASVARGATTYLLQRSAEGVVLSARRTLVSRLLQLPVAEYDRRRIGDLMSRVGADTTALRGAVTSGLVELGSSLLVLVGAIVAMALVDVVLLGAALVCLAAALFVVLPLTRRMRALATTTQARVGEMTAGVERALSAVRTVRASRATERETAAVVEGARGAYDAGVRAARFTAVLSPVAGLALQGSFLLVLGLGGYRVATGAITVAQLVSFVLYLFLLITPLTTVIQVSTQVQAALGALTRIDEVIALPLEGQVAAPAGAAREDDALLAFDAVSFSYADGTDVLHEVSFALPAGSRTAVVGPSGAGKSTLLALVERFYDVTGGAIRLGGTDLRALPHAQLRARLGYVEQESPVLAGTLRENLLLAAPGAAEAEQRAVLATVNLGGVAERSPLGLDAPVGDSGVLLSGGERQRLAIARALLAAPELLLLDEPTASLDARNEQALRDVLTAAAATRTLLVVAHRLSTVVDSDQIVVLDRGRVVGTGTHEELLETTPLYRELARTQLLA